MSKDWKKQEDEAEIGKKMKQGLGKQEDEAESFLAYLWKYGSDTTSKQAEKSQYISTD